MGQPKLFGGNLEEYIEVHLELSQTQEVAGLMLQSGTILLLRLIMKSFLQSFFPSAYSGMAFVSYWQRTGH